MLAAQLFVPFVKGYQPSWIVGKIVAAGAIAWGCYAAACAKKTVPLKM